MSDAILKDAREQYKEGQEAWSDAKTKWAEDMRFARLGEQWPQSMLRKREAERRPCLTINRLPSFIRQVVNDARQNKPQIKIHPMDSGADKETAEVLSGLVKQIEASSNADVAYDMALEHAVSGGFGFFRINIGYAYDDAFEQCLEIEPISNPMAVTWDAASIAADASDWRYAFVEEWLPKAVFGRDYKGAQAVNWDGDYRGLSSEWMRDDAVLVAEWWTREKAKRKVLRLSNGQVMAEEDYLRVIDGVPTAAVLQSQGVVVVGDRLTDTHKVTQRTITGAEELETVAWVGTLIPISAVYGEDITVDGERHFVSLTRQAKDAQRNFNYWRTAATELVALAPKAPFVGPVGAFDTDRAKWETANVDPHPYLEYDGAVQPQRQAFAGVPAGVLQEALNASDDLKSIMGLFDASLGAKSNETSGRAIMARQREGDVATFHFIDNLSRGIRYAGRVLVELIPKVYNTSRMLRIIGADETEKSVQINTQGTFDLTVGKYDVTVDVGPAFTSRREEAANGMLEMIRAMPAVAPLIGDLLAKAADWPNSDEIAKRLKVMLPPNILQAEEQDLPPQAQAQIAQLMGQMQQMQQALQVKDQQLAQASQAVSQIQQENAILKIRSENRQAELANDAKELQLREREVDNKHHLEMSKVAGGIEEERIKAFAEEVVARIEAQTQAISQQVEAVSQTVSKPAEDTDSIKVELMELAERMNNSGVKTITIQAPSGGVYEAIVSDSAVQITAPSGAVYRGQIATQVQQ